MPSHIKSNLLSGLTVALALVPEAIAFALLAQVSPLTGLYAAVLVCFITSAFGGRPGMVSAAAGSLAVVMVALVVQHGAQYLFAAVVLMGGLQLLFAAAKLGKFIRMVPHPVMLGFVNGLALLIFFAQFGHFKTRGPDGAMQWMPGAELATMLAIAAATMAVIYLAPRITKAVPSTLVGILLATAGCALLGVDTKTVGDLGSIAGGLPAFSLPDVPFNLETLYIVFPYALVLAGVGLIESLLTLTLVDEITGTRGQPNRESLALGAANVASGLFGGMGGCALIGQSMINVNSGGTGRLAGVAAALFLLSFILVGSHWIEQVPLAALVGVMFVVCEKTFEWGTFRLFGKVPRADALVIVLVAGLTLAFDLAVAVLAGVVVSALVFAWQHARQVTVATSIDAQGWKVYALDGTLFFASSASFSELFTPAQDPQDVVVEFLHARVADHSAIQAIDALAERYRALGKRLHLRHLSPDCRELLGKASDMIEVNLLEDPRYRVADDKLG
ncbi:SulP family inorganic anion transporter [Massilia yuzhufengensis]|uniref:Sulfate permease, SulP family n=1 Tax=Massilia yuzhufengensis TaxID=1164594 RepID=A0A1I1Q844_9BURK|nr:SulP family inorganic anion transporter [Massilia yuzhufengensis]SFD18284.1 sulfate permease, SulP family [Massilia yuzhufengensis]